MINTSDIRLGNLFIDKVTHRILVVDQITREHTVFDFLDKIPCPLPEGWQAEPIPLTPDVLMKCGFVKSVSDWDKKSLAWVNKITLYDHENGTYSLYRYNDWKVFVDALHDLQNLYRSITGTELKYQP